MIRLYEDMIADGICPEQARFVLPQGVEVSWIWTGNLYAFANFYKKRTDKHAQKEIRDLAESVDRIMDDLFPYSWPALTKENDK
jgi:thymidylate synthase (FAD)